ERECESASADARAELFDGDAVLDRRQQRDVRWERPVLRARYAVEVRSGPGGPKRGRGVEGRRQVQRREDGDAGRREIAVEVDAVHVHQVDVALAEHTHDGLAGPVLRGAPHLGRERARGRGRGGKRAARGSTRGGGGGGTP